MEITFTDLAGILQSIRDTEPFDGKDDIHEFMDRLDDFGDTKLYINFHHGVLIFTTSDSMED